MPDFVDSVFNVASQGINTITGVAQLAADTAYELLPQNAAKNARLAPFVPTPKPTRSVFAVGLNKMARIWHRNPQFAKLMLFVGLPLAFRSIYSYPVRRALRLPSPVVGNGTTRFEVVLIIGQADSPFISKLIHDLNKRGYVVYVTVENERELQLIENMQDNDIRHLWIDWSSDSTVKSSLLKLAKVLDTPINSTNGVSSSQEFFYNFKAVLFSPNYNHLPKARNVTDIHTGELQRVMDAHFAKLNTLLYNGLSSIMTESNIRRDELLIANGLRGDYTKESKWKQITMRTLYVIVGMVSSVLGLNGLLCPGGVSKGGATKLLWLNFLVQYTSQGSTESDYGISSSSYLSSYRTKMIIELLYSMNNSYFKILHSEMGTSLIESICRAFGTIRNPFQLDMAMVNVDIIKGHGGFTKHKSYDSGTEQSVFGNVNKVISTTCDSLWKTSCALYQKTLNVLLQVFDLAYDSISLGVALITGSHYGGRRRGVTPRRVHYLIFDLINSPSLFNEYWIS